MKLSMFVSGWVACLVLEITTAPYLRAAVQSTAKPVSLDNGFKRPADATRPWVYWMWMDGNVSREGITADLEAMKRAGIGGVIIMEVNVGIPRGPIQFMSVEWRQRFKHAVSEAERLGLQITLNAGPGWTGSGGPWIKPEQSMQHLVASSVEVVGPKNFSDLLPQPKPRPPFLPARCCRRNRSKPRTSSFGTLPVLAFPTPENPYRIADIDEKALYVRAPYSSQPKVKPYLPLPVKDASMPLHAIIRTNQIVDLTSLLAADGRLTWPVPEGRWTILRFGRTSTGANTRPAPEPGLGLECDKLDPAALDTHFEAFIGTLLRDLGHRQVSSQQGWTTLHIDSWEMGAQNWTAAFRDEFRRRRGYDPILYLPVLTGRVVETLEVAERFLWDLRQTVHELIVENHARHLKELGQRHGFKLSIEPYDMTPCADMGLGAVADVPMCEFWLYGFDTSYSVYEASSIAHTGGRNIVAAEAFTSTDVEHWQAYPGSMKALGDWAFCAGVNRLVFHRYQHQPWLDLKPGMTMGPYGVHWERTQTWWDLVPAYHRYLSRCQFLLRQGLPVAEVCFLVAEGAPHVFRPPPSATRGNPPDRLGYNFDGCAPDTLLDSMSVKNGKLIMPDGMSYRLLILPERTAMTPRLLSKISELVRSGATVLGPRPVVSPSLSGYPRCDEEVKRLGDEMWGDINGLQVQEHHFDKGRVIWRQPGVQPTPQPSASQSMPDQYGDFSIAVDTLVGMGINPDFQSDATLRYTHRRDGEVDIYLVANPETRQVRANCQFRIEGRQPELWDAVTGNMRMLPEFSVNDHRTSIPLSFEPCQSFFVVFRKPLPSRKSPGINFPASSPVIELSGPWEVSFDPQWGGPENITFSKLDDWSQRVEPGIKYYSGKAVYRKTFDLPNSSAARGRSSLYLRLGLVNNLAQVTLNGHDLGVAWCAPWEVEMTGAVKPTANHLEITVANLWPNRLIGDEQMPADGQYGAGGNLARWPEWLLKNEPRPVTHRYTFTTWKHFNPDTALMPSGLLGPVTIVQTP